MRADLGGAEAGGDAGRGEERDLERGRAQDQVAPDQQLRAHHRAVRAQPATGRACQRTQEQRRADRLGDDVGDRRAGQPEAHRVDEDRAQQRRRGVRGEHDHHRLAGALHPAHPAVAGEHQQHAGQADDTDAEPGLGGLLRRTRPAGEQAGERAGEHLAERDDHQPDAGGQPGRLHALVHRVGQPPGAEPACRPRGRAVLDERADHREQRPSARRRRRARRARSSRGARPPRCRRAGRAARRPAPRPRRPTATAACGWSPRRRFS